MADSAEQMNSIAKITEVCTLTTLPIDEAIIVYDTKKVTTGFG